MNITSVLITAAVTIAASLLLKKDKPEMATAIGIAGGVLIGIEILSQLGTVFDGIKEIVGGMENVASFLSPILKICVLTMAGQSVSELCKEAGHPYLAGKVELALRVAMLLLALPMLGEVLKQISELIGGMR